MRIMGLDVGSHTIGVAISDELGMTAQPFATIRRKSMEEDMKEIDTIIAHYGIGKIVVGLPRNMNGTLGKQAEAMFKWIKAFQKRIHFPIVTWDERLSTVGATRVLLEADVSREKRKKVIDKLAAVFILQGYLNKTRIQNNDSTHPA
jgi:putative holliday junction resolvase